MQNDANAAEIEHSRAVRDMFAGIAGRYDLLNHLLSLNIDRSWRRKVAGEIADILNDPNALVLDVACGTGDLTIELKKEAKATIIGTDFCRPMLEIAKDKTDISFIEADAMKLPVADGQFDGVTIAFGLRNLANLENALVELRRVLKSNGRLAVLEFSTPVVPGFGHLFSLYFSRVLPLIGGAVSGSRGAYQYLPASVAIFPDQKRLAEMMRDNGFDNVRYTNLTGGIAAMHLGTK